MQLRFRVPDEAEMERPPTQRDQFDNDDVELVDALVREAIQNSLDAKLKNCTNPVRVRFSVGITEGGQVEQVNALLDPKKLNFHLRACDLAEIDPNVPCTFLVIEDFGTSGLSGSWSSWDEKPFCDFWRRMGRSHKGGQALGRWGLGKLVFSSSSQARVFLGLTVREGETSRLLMGQAVLTTHRLPDGTRQDSHGFYAAPGCGIQLPITDDSIIDTFCNVFRASRKHESGLTIAVPYLRQNISLNRIIKGVLRNYFFPILFGRLVVEAGEEVIDSQSFAALTERLDPTHFANGELAAFIQTMKETRDPSALPPAVLPQSWPKHASLDASLGHALDNLKDRLNGGHAVVLRAPLVLKKKDGTEHQTFVDVFLKRAQVDVPALFVRGAIVLNAESKYFRGRKVFAALIADDPAISEFLGDAENPAHTGWSASAEKVCAHWRASRERLSEIRSLPQKAYNSLVSAVETYDKDALIDIFSVPSDQGSKGDRNKGGRIDPKIVPEIVPRQKHFRIAELPDGFSVRAGNIEESDVPFSIRIRIAYDVGRGNPFQKHDPSDFDLRKKQIKFFGKGMKLSAQGAAVLQIDVEDKDFSVDVRGFDINRDLIIDPERI